MSLKALHLTDEEILSGLVASFGELEPGLVVIARYYPSDQKMTPELKEHLQLIAVGESLSSCERVWLSEGHEILRWGKLGPREACLVVSRYSF